MNPKRFEKKFVGSKGGAGVPHRIINQIGPHRVFIEPFAGEATIARTMRPADEIILIDRVQQPGLDLDRASLKKARFILGDGIAFLDTYKFKGDEFVYADPPYLLAARMQRGRAYYEHEWPDAMHRRFLRVAKAINSRVAISGYHSPLYDDELSDWRRIEFEVMTRGGTKALEVLWMNYPRPTVLHDFSFVGENWRARWNIRRKIRRGIQDLLGMPPLERNAVFHALCQAMKGNAATPAAAPEPEREASAAARAETGAVRSSTGRVGELVNAGN